MSITPADERVAEWLRAEHGDEIATRFLRAADLCPPEHQRKLIHLARLLFALFPGNRGTGELDFPTALAFFGLPPLSHLGLGPHRQKFTAGHLIVHMAGHGAVPPTCKSWPAGNSRPVRRTPLFALNTSEAPE